MRYTSSILSAAALIGVAVASPAPQLDLGAVITAAPATISGPAISAVAGSVTINQAALSSSISAAVTAVASASSTAVAPSAPVKRDLAERDLLSSLSSWLAGLSGVKVATTSAAKTSCTTKTTAASSTTTSFFSSMTLTSTTTTQSGTGTSTSSSTTACPTTPEAGTYCGFINPEDPCAPQPDGYGPKVSPDTVNAFEAYAPFHAQASQAPTPSGYARTFVDYNASTSANSYLGLYTLSSYDTAGCAAHCDNTTLCTAFNIYIERDPSQNPTNNDSTAPTVWGYNCPNPSSITNYKCTLWGSSLDNTTATNAGGWREQFQVVIVGSNGYDKTNNTTPATVPSYNAPQNCSGSAFNAGSYWMGSKFFPGPFNPSLCSAYATAQTALNKASAISAGTHSYTPCNMFNAYHLHKNSVPLGTYCSLYSQSLTTSWATLSGRWSGSDYYGCQNSWSYSLSVTDSGKC